MFFANQNSLSNGLLLNILKFKTFDTEPSAFDLFRIVSGVLKCF